MGEKISLNSGTILGGCPDLMEMRPSCQPRTKGEEVKFHSEVETASRMNSCTCFWRMEQK